MHDAYIMIERGWCGFYRGLSIEETRKVAVPHLEVATFGLFMHSVTVGDFKKGGNVHGV